MGTLYITGNSDSDKLLNSNGTALLIGMLLDQQVPMEWAFNGAYTLKQRLGHLNPRTIGEMEPDEFLAVCLEKPAIHRFPKAMAQRIQGMCAIIGEKYKNKGENIWNDVASGDELFTRLRELPGFGEEKAQIFIALLGKRFDVQPAGWKKAAGVFSDSHPRTVADITSPETLLKVRAWKKAEKAADRDKQSRPMPAKKTAAKKTASKK
ncbi:unannotated protein [freshwater metagenome]|uniref:Unannotated protein n=1 Tax=freshwater metagenome TaxID=449393 RepID=A0A6J6LM06_9ZZZZ